MKHAAREYLKGEPKIVKVIMFDKTTDKNWLVTWHQDKTVSLNTKKDIPGWGPWSLKDGIHHVQPDLSVLEDMITFRVHLDDADETNGCLKVIPGSHNLGILKQSVIDQTIADSQEFICSATKGDLLVMRPHLLHSSSKGSVPNHRRIVHVEYSSFELPEGLSWA